MFRTLQPGTVCSGPARCAFVSAPVPGLAFSRRRPWEPGLCCAWSRSDRQTSEVVRNLGPFGNAASSLSGRYNVTGGRLAWRTAYESDGPELRAAPAVRSVEVRAALE